MINNPNQKTVSDYLYAVLTPLELRRISSVEAHIDLQAALLLVASGDFDKLEQYMQAESFKERLKIDSDIILRRQGIYLRDEILDPLKPPQPERRGLNF